MSVFGNIQPPRHPSLGILSSTIWMTGRPHDCITVHHVTLETALEHPGLVPYLHRCFKEEVERGRTYPHELARGQEYTQKMFEDYFFAGDVMIGIIGDEDLADSKLDGSDIFVRLKEAKSTRTWLECMAGFYYLKPNYPGRSSHICNGEILLPPAHRARKFGLALARSALHYAPRLGYEAAVFNLVYVNNVASLKLWEALKFMKVGVIPRAGRLRRADGSGEEYVDAWVFYKRLDQGIRVNQQTDCKKEITYVGARATKSKL